MVLPMITLIAHAATETSQAATSAGIGAIGIDARALLFQLVNFAILLFLLRRFAYKPILRVLQQRQQKIEASLKNAQEIETAKAELTVQQRQVLHSARFQAQEIVTQSTAKAAGIIKAAEQQAQAQAEKILTQGRSHLTQEAAEIKGKLKHEVLQLVATATESIIDVKLDPKQDAALIQRAVADAQKQTKEN